LSPGGQHRLERPSGFRQFVAQGVALRAGIEMAEQPICLHSIECADDEDRKVAAKSLTLGR
jgi:hypothetical protein